VEASDALRATRDPAVFDRLEAHFRFEWIFLDGRPEQRRARFLATRRDWRLVYWDDLALIYVRANSAQGRRLNADIYQQLEPSDALGSLERALEIARPLWAQAQQKVLREIGTKAWADAQRRLTHLLHVAVERRRLGHGRRRARSSPAVRSTSS